MLKRLAVISDSDRMYRTMDRAARDLGDVQVVHVRPGRKIPRGTVALVSGSKDAAASLKAALELGAGHEQILCLLAEAIDCREAFAPGSSFRVRDHATRFASVIGLSPDNRLTLERAALVRDIGKLRIPNEILLKQGLLTYEEWGTLHKHPELGAEMLRGISLLRDTADVVHRHHECYDGTGYPDGLEAQEIPYLARAMKIIDVYCAMTSPRLYRKGLSSHEEALKHLTSESGKLFDPAMVRLFVDSKVGQY